MKSIKTEYGYKVRQEKGKDIEVWNEDKKLVAAFTKSDIRKISKNIR